MDTINGILSKIDAFDIFVRYFYSGYVELHENKKQRNMKKSENEDLSYRMRKCPHLFILGAGATKATIPNGDKNGYKSPVMDGFLEEMGLNYLLDTVKLKTKSHNIETIYSELVENPQYKDIVDKIENEIITYYQKIQITDKPTLYDYLILSLRKKDCIATFNWDPLLIQAYNRVNKITIDLPNMLFLHSCVEVGICEECNQAFPLRNKFCPKCRKPLKMPKLLFPVAHKDYAQNVFIKNSWSAFDNYIKKACIVSIWGYSAPFSDKEARKRILKAFSSSSRSLDNIEIIDIASKKQLYKKWEPFIKKTNGNFKVYTSIFDSLIGEFPRRSVDGYTKRYIDNWWNESSLKLKKCNSFEELSTLIKPALDNEKNNNYDVITIPELL